jgi:hypothetical protein
MSMVARIKTPNSIQRALNYNEQKVQQGCAELLSAPGYLKDAERLNFYEKLEGFTRLIELNDSITNSLHISLNFAAEDILDKEKLVQIADDYMERIGFAEQPYLVYQHFDAGHRHIHVVTTNIRADGTRIDTYNIGRNQSETARKVIEKNYGLVAADDRQRKQSFEVKPITAQRVKYGRSETKRAIQNVLELVLKEYHYTSLPELNAVLRQYNVLADQGGKESRIFQNDGLVYRVLDDKGNKIGVPIKSSDIYHQPTLKFLLAKFAENSVPKPKEQARIRNSIDLALHHKNPSLPDLIATLKKEGIDTVLRLGEGGILYGITYVDHKEKCVFNGSSLGKNYSAKAIHERCTIEPSAMNQTQHLRQANSQFLKTLMQPEYTGDSLPFDLKRNRKKKKKLNINQ